MGADVGVETTLEQLPVHSFGRTFLWGRSLGLREQPAFRIDVRRTPQRAVPRTAMARYEPTNKILQAIQATLKVLAASTDPPSY